MIKKEYIEVKRLYFPPKVMVHYILNEGLMDGYVSGDASSDDFKKDEEDDDEVVNTP